MAFSAVMAAATAYSAYSSNQQRQQMKGANYKAEQNAIKQEKQAEQDMNRANQKKPDTMAMLNDAAQKGRAGQSGTMLTGPQGVDPSMLTLGKNTLLGGG